MSAVSVPTDCPCAADLYCPLHPMPPARVQAAKDYQVFCTWAPVLRGLPKSPNLDDSPMFIQDPNDPARRAPKLPARFFIVGNWEIVAHHLRLYTISLFRRDLLKGLSLEVINDHDLIARRYERDYEKPTFSEATLKASLQIIRLGYQRSKNTELPAILLETMLLRADKRLPLILVSEPSHPWSKSHLAWSSEVDSFLEAKFTRLNIR